MRLAIRRLLAAALLGAVLAGACGSPSPAAPGTVRPAASAEGSPASPSEPAASAAGPSCAEAGIRRALAFNGRLVPALESLWTAALASDADPAGIAKDMRSISATLTAFSDLGPALAGCPETVALADGALDVQDDMSAVLTEVLQGSIRDTELQRRGAVRLLLLVPSLIAFADAVLDTTRTLGLERLLPAVDPLSSLRPLAGSLAAGPPAGTTPAEYATWAGGTWKGLDPLVAAMRKAGSSDDDDARREAAQAVLDAVVAARSWLATKRPWACYASTWSQAGDALAANERAARAYLAGKLKAATAALKSARSLETRVKAYPVGVVDARCQLEPATAR